MKDYVVELAELGVKETGMGRAADKALKHQVTIEKNPRSRRFKSICFQWR